MRNRRVLATGAFDLLHYGHLNFLEEAKKAGGKKAELVVLVARDETIEARKGKKPVVPEDQRRALVEALKPVDDAILGFKDMNYEAVIEKLKPDIIAVGYDQTDIRRSVEEAIKKKGLKIEIFVAGKFSVDDLDSSSKIKRRVIELEKNSAQKFKSDEVRLHGIRARNLQQSIRFYKRVVGMVEIGRGKMSAGGVYVDLKTPGSGQRLDPNYYPSDTKFYEPYGSGCELDHLAFWIRDVDGQFKRLIS